LIDEISMSASSHAPEPQPVLIIGSGLAGWTLARELRKLSSDLPITLVTEGGGDFYAKPALSNALAQKKAPEALLNTPGPLLAEQLGVRLVAHTRVQAIDRVAQRVQTDSGTLAYAQLVLATGAQPIRLPLAGAAATEMLSVNAWTDYREFHAKLVSSPHQMGVSSYEKNSIQSARQGPQIKRIVILGAGLIGCEFANDLAAAGHAVTVVDPGSRALAALLPEGASLALQAALGALGVQWKWGQSVQRVEFAPGLDGQELRAQLADQSWLACDLLLSAVGLRPDLSLAQAAGLNTERGVVVNAQLQTSDPQIFALGDAAQYAQQSLGSVSRPLPYVLPIMQAAKVLASNLMAQRAGQDLTALRFPLMPVAIKTPALPLTIAAPAPGAPGQWHSVSEGQEWEWREPQGRLAGFALAGPAAAQRGKWVKALEAAA
jgi:rubredoxin---NAD+ reductase